MEEETKKEPVEPKEEGWAEKAKKLIDKADDFIDGKVDKVKKSKAFGDFKESLDKAEEYVDDKIENIKKQQPTSWMILPRVSGREPKMNRNLKILKPIHKPEVFISSHLSLSPC